MQRIKCNWCEWEGTEAELDLKDGEEYEQYEYCPECGNKDFLMDI